MLLPYAFIYRSVTSIRGELVPFLVRKQFSKSLNSKNATEDTEKNQKQQDAHHNLGKVSLVMTRVCTVHICHSLKRMFGVHNIMVTFQKPHTCLHRAPQH